MNDDFQKLWRQQEEKLAQRLAELTNLPYIDLSLIPFTFELLDVVESDKLSQAQAVIFFKDGHKLKIGVIDPKNPQTENLIEELKQKNYDVQVYIISKTSLERGLAEIERLKKKQKEVISISTLTIDTQLINRVQNEVFQFADLDKIIKEHDQPNKSFYILEVIVSSIPVFKPSDIHFEPQKEAVVIRFRIDGILHEVSSISFKSYQLIKNRLKLLSGMKLSFKKIAQDGRFSLTLKDKNFEVRSSVIPGDYDETFVLRILDPEVTKLGLDKLGFREDQLEIVKRNLIQPNGMILTTGPTGSGKTTTLYTFLNFINSPTIKIITLEDPIEYKLSGIQQTQVDPKSGYTFSSGLRAILRQDPDVILVGEIRDEETAQIAINAALTGHLVISTLHTNNSLGAIARLVNLKVKKDLIPPALRLVIAQRLVRRICSFCTQFIEPEPKVKNKILQELENLPSFVKEKYPISNFTLPQIRGCQQCNFLGYKGRLGIFEMFEVTLDLGDEILKDPSEQNIFNFLQQKGFVNLIQDGLLKVISHQTSLEELTRVLGFLVD